MSFNNLTMRQQLFQPATQVQQSLPRGPPRQHDEQLYSGQWTKEEQDYVAALVEGFKEGSLDIPEGTSLRFYIAAELGCKPKRYVKSEWRLDDPPFLVGPPSPQFNHTFAYRVSKKYERSGYNGKHVFHKDTSLSEKELKERRASLQKLKVAFRKSRDLVLSMQEAKVGSNKNQSKETTAGTNRSLPTSSFQGTHLTNQFNSNLAALRSMDERLALMRSQIERSSAALAMSGRGAFIPPSNGLGGGLGNGPRAEMLYSMLMTSQARARPGMSEFRASGLSGPYSSLGGSLLQDVYQRRQQLLMESTMPLRNSGRAAMFAGAVPTVTASPGSTKRSLAALSSAGSSSPPIANLPESIEERDAKRARAA